MKFGITFKGEMNSQRSIAIARQIEIAGFEYAWFFDSHILWRDCYHQMARVLEHTTKIKTGPLVTNPNVRDWSVAASMFATLSVENQNRFELAVGRGDSSMRVMGKRPATLDRMAEFIHAIKGMVRGDEVTYDDCPSPVKLEWANGYDLPAWVAAYGPKALACAGEHGDGLVVQLSDPDLCKWFSNQAIQAGEKIGRDMSEFKVLSCAPVWVGDKDLGYKQTKWFPAMVGNHVADVVEKYGLDSGLIPDSLTQYIENRRGANADEGYNYKEHANKESDNSDYVSQEITESFCILGEPSEHIEKLKKLEDSGVDLFVIYLTNGEEERIIGEYAEHIIPHFS
tara:strand:+ start:34651 stop:35670 length:1020 start_codon:yes stop_codon:yes gene_type:complete